MFSYPRLFPVESTEPCGKVGSALGVDVGGDLLHHLGKGGVGTHLLLHLIQRVQHRGVVPVTKFLADVVEGEIGHAANDRYGLRTLQ